MQARRLADPLPFVSVIVPTYEDARLPLCLDALENQTYPLDRYEVIVVDNGSREQIDAAPFAHVRLVREDRPGSYAARNRGLSVAQGTHLAFTDSDCIPARDWLETGVAALLAAPDCGLVGGQVTVFYQAAERPTLVELYEQLFAFDIEDYVTRQHFCATCNLFTFRQVFERVGAFDPNVQSSGDFLWTRAVYGRGYALLYDARVRVAHPARRTFRALYQKASRLAGGDVYALKKQSGRAYVLNYRLYRDLKPPLGKLAIIWAQPSFSLRQKLGVSFAACFAQAGRFFEKLRILVGVPSRTR